MDEHALRELIEDVRARRLSRRRLVQALVGLGLDFDPAGQYKEPGILAVDPTVTTARRALRWTSMD